MIIIGIDPGPEKSGYVQYAEARVYEHGHTGNENLYHFLRSVRELHPELAIEFPEFMHKPFGSVMRDTCRCVGKCEAYFDRPDSTHLIKRSETGLHLCGLGRAKAPVLRAALIERFGGEKAIGGKKCPKCKGKGWRGRGRPQCDECKGSGWLHPPGPLHGLVTEHVWMALAVANTCEDGLNERARETCVGRKAVGG